MTATIIGLALAGAALRVAQLAYVRSIRRARRQGRAEALRWTKGAG